MYILYSGAEANLAVALYSLSVQVSCLMVFTMHGIVQPSRGTYPIHCKNHETTITCIYIYMHTMMYTVAALMQLWLCVIRLSINLSITY